MNNNGNNLPAINVSNGMLAPQNFQEALEFGRLISQSGMVPKDYQGNVGAVLVAMQMGAEVGLSPMAAIQNISVINGRPSLWGDAMLAVVTSHPECEDVVEEFDPQRMLATCTVIRRGRQPVTRAFSMDDAQTAGLSGKQGPWKQYPKRMLQMRARSWACRDAFPDALRGIRCAEEEQDAVIDVTPERADVTEPGIHKFGRRKRALEEGKRPEPVETTEEPRPERKTEPEKPKASSKRKMSQKTLGELQEELDAIATAHEEAAKAGDNDQIAHWETEGKRVSEEIATLGGAK